MFLKKGIHCNVDDTRHNNLNIKMIEYNEYNNMII